MEVSGQLHVPAALAQRKGPRYRNGDEKKSIHSSCCESNPGRPARSVFTELPRVIGILP